MGLAVCFNCASGHRDPGTEGIHTRTTAALASIPLALLKKPQRPETGACPACASPLAGEGGGLLAAGYILARDLLPEYSTR